MTRPAGAVAPGTRRTMADCDASLVPTMSVGPESSRAWAVVAISVNATERDDADGLTALPLPAVPPHDASRTSASVALDAERETIGEHLREPACVDTSLRLGHLIRRTIEGDGPRVGVEHGVRRARVTVAWLPDAAGVDERAFFEAVGRSFRDMRCLRAGRGEMKERRDMRVSVAAVIGLRELECRGRRARRRHVFPERIAETAVA